MSPCSNARIYGKSKPCKPCILHSPLPHRPSFVVHISLQTHMHIYISMHWRKVWEIGSHLTLYMFADDSHSPRVNIGILKHFLLLFLFPFIVVLDAHTFSISSFHDIFPVRCTRRILFWIHFSKRVKKKKKTCSGSISMAGRSSSRPA